MSTYDAHSGRDHSPDQARDRAPERAHDEVRDETEKTQRVAYDPALDQDTRVVPQQSPAPEEARPRVAYLVTGLVFLGVVLLWALLVTGVLSTANLRWVGSAMLVVAGAAGLAVSLVRGRRHAP